ncbi:MAG: UDP-N-acetylglucosamine 2-epimerase [Pseudorhodoplanes sp.]|nr:UDP-N-acetylglucosamine 2-epimerase [Pseudorhodoplanes sp.]
MTATRAEYGLLRWIAHDIGADARFDLDLVVTGSHLSGRHGATVAEIEADGHEISARIPVMLERTDAQSLAQVSATIVTGFAEYLDRRRPDVVLVLGDRWELLPVATACTIAAIPMGHFHGGEVTEGALDDGVRHALTKLSHLHFVANDVYGRRVRQLGEEEWRICICGAPGLDNFHRLQLLDRQALSNDLGLDFARPTALVAFHATTRGSDADGVNALVQALTAARERFGLQYVITAPGADPGADVIDKALQAFAAGSPQTVYVASLGTVRFLSVMNHARLMIGNSSSAYYEAPAAGLPAVDIGNRQKGRIRPDNVIGVGTSCDAILDGIEKALSASVSPRQPKEAVSKTAIEYLASIFIDRSKQTLLGKKFVDDRT